MPYVYSKQFSSMTKKGLKQLKEQLGADNRVYKLCYKMSLRGFNIKDIDSKTLVEIGNEIEPHIYDNEEVSNLYDEIAVELHNRYKDTLANVADKRLTKIEGGNIPWTKLGWIKAGISDAASAAKSVIRNPQQFDRNKLDLTI